MINFKGLHRNAVCMQKIADAGITLSYVDNVLHVSDAIGAQAIIDSFTLAEARAPLVLEVKVLAKTKILAFLPDWKQSNCNARMNELNMLRSDRGWSEQEREEVAALRALWDHAKAIRVASDAHEANLASLTTFDAIAEYDITANWP